MDWKNYFKKHILERGYEYYCCGNVNGFQLDEHCITATVCGNENYEVRIECQDGEVTSMECTCPYAKDGKACKHMAAILFAWELEALETVKPARNETTSSTLTAEDMVALADDRTVRAFLTELLKENASLRREFRHLLPQIAGEVDIKQAKAEIDGLAYEYSDRSGFIDWNNAWGYCSELEQILNREGEALVGCGNLKEAFNLSNYIFVKVQKQDMDDSDGGVTEVAETCKEFWYRVYERADMELKYYMLRIFMNLLKEDQLVLPEYLETFLMEEFQEDEFMALKLQFTDEMAELAAEKPDDYGGYITEKWAAYHIGLMQNKNFEWESVAVYCKKFWKYHRIRDFYIDECVKRKMYGEAVEVLKESKILAKDYWGLASGYCKRLKEVYKRLGDMESYRKELWELIVVYRDDSLETFREMKAQYPAAEWEKKRQLVFEKLEQSVRLGGLFREEKLYDRLMDFAEQSDGLYRVQEYEKELVKLYPERVLEKYLREVRQRANRTTGRKTYQEIVRILRHMKGLKGGKACVQELVQQWRTTYRSRRAMMEELDRL